MTDQHCHPPACKGDKASITLTRILPANKPKGAAAGLLLQGWSYGVPGCEKAAAAARVAPEDHCRLCRATLSWKSSLYCPDVVYKRMQRKATLSRQGQHYHS